MRTKVILILRKLIDLLDNRKTLDYDIRQVVENYVSEGNTITNLRICEDAKYLYKNVMLLDVIDSKGKTKVKNVVVSYKVGDIK